MASGVDMCREAVTLLVYDGSNDAGQHGRRGLDRANLILAAQPDGLCVSVRQSGASMGGGRREEWGGRGGSGRTNDQRPTITARSQPPGPRSYYFLAQHPFVHLLLLLIGRYVCMYVYMYVRMYVRIIT
jgi:hypothetical protein